MQIQKVIDEEARNAQFEISSSQREPKSNSLWVDKYAPRRFIDLISDERTNREV